MIVVGFLIAAAAATLVRWQVGHALPSPFGTLAVNLVGAFALGLLHGASTTTHTLVGVAALGSLTTFSTLMAELLELGRSRRGAALAYGTATVVGGVALAWLGLRLG